MVQCLPVSALTSSSPWHPLWCSTLGWGCSGWRPWSHPPRSLERPTWCCSGLGSCGSGQFPQSCIVRQPIQPVLTPAGVRGTCARTHTHIEDRCFGYLLFSAVFFFLHIISSFCRFSALFPCLNFVLDTFTHNTKHMLPSWWFSFLIWKLSSFNSSCHSFNIVLFSLASLES